MEELKLKIVYKGKNKKCMKLRSSSIWKLLPNHFCGLLSVLTFLKQGEPGGAQRQRDKK